MAREWVHARAGDTVGVTVRSSTKSRDVQGGEPLSSTDTLAEVGVLDGSILRLEPAARWEATGTPPPRTLTATWWRAARPAGPPDVCGGARRSGCAPAGETARTGDSWTPRSDSPGCVAA